ncbi:MAG: hypothetical protein A4E29_00144 [Methanomassiliicoccales archaeon PtaB.Bin134]|nr:MAG: hypothetical protein A4E29_00144 [Methanomassiliicoccales archaeon PtaB.Bin134]
MMLSCPQASSSTLIMPDSITWWYRPSRHWPMETTYSDWAYQSTTLVPKALSMVSLMNWGSCSEDVCTRSGVNSRLLPDRSMAMLKR